MVGSRSHGVVYPGWTGYEGGVWVLSGVDGATVHYWLGAQYGDYLGTSVDGGVDINADGYMDIMVGATGVADPGGVGDFGAAFVYSGKDGSVLLASYGDPANPTGSGTWTVTGWRTVPLAIPFGARSGGACMAERSSYPAVQGPRYLTGRVRLSTWRWARL